MPDEPDPLSEAEASEADRLIAQALRSVLDSVPDLPGGDIAPPETSPTAQPWAETAAPPGRNKRPLEELLADYQRRVEAAPGAMAGHPDEKHPTEAFLDRFSPRGGGAPSSGRGRRRRGRGRGSKPSQQAAPAQPGQTPQAPQAGQPPAGQRRRRRRGRRRGPRTTAPE